MVREAQLLFKAIEKEGLQEGGSVPISGTFPFWTHKSLCFEAYPAVKMALHPLQGHYQSLLQFLFTIPLCVA